MDIGDMWNDLSLYELDDRHGIARQFRDTVAGSSKGDGKGGYDVSFGTVLATLLIAIDRLEERIIAIEDSQPGQ